MSGNGPAVDESGDIYLSVGDGSNDGTASTTDFGDTVVKISLDAANRIRVRDWYAPANQRELKEKDQDLGSAGVVPIPNSRLLLAGGKEGRMYLIDRNAMGKGGPSLDSFIATRDKTGEHYYNIHGAPVIWKRSDGMFVYVNGEESPLNRYKLVPDTVPGGAGWKFDSQTPRNRFDPLRPFATSCAQLDALNCTSAPFTPFPTGMFGNKSRGMVWMPGGFLSLSADQDKAGTGIIWDSMPYADNANMAVVPGVLRAFDASNVSHQLWDSEHGHDQNDKLGQFAKFCLPVVANGKVYVSAFQAEMIREADKMHTKDSGGDQPALAIYGLK
jgi:hypothetical protein